MKGISGSMLEIARHGALITLGGTLLLAEAGGRLLAHARDAGERYLRTAREWRLPTIALGRLERKR